MSGNRATDYLGADGHRVVTRINVGKKLKRYIWHQQSSKRVGIEMTNGEKIKEIFPDTKIITQYDNPFGDRFIVFTLNNEDMQVNIEWWNAEYKEPSNSEKPNKSIEEKCPCYHCEYFEIKGWSHCKIHENAYGDSRCNDYRKANQGSNKVNQGLNKSEIPTGSTNTISFKEMADNLKITAEDIESAEDLEYSIEPLVHPKNDLGVDCISRDGAIKALDYDIKYFEFKSGVSKHMDDIAKLLNTIYETQVNNIKALPSVTPIRPKGHWKTDRQGDMQCSRCGHQRPYFIDYTSEGCKVRGELTPFCPKCGSDNREVEECQEKKEKMQ